MKLAITGQDGFIGYHLYNTLKFKYSSYEVLDFKSTLFKDEEALDSLVSNLDIIVHLAGVNRSASESDILDKNLFLTQQLVGSIERTNFNGKLIFASSIKRNESNAYGKSKRLSSELFLKASKENHFTFINLVIPNVFGPFCKPNYNSFVATFCYNSINNLKNTIKDNNQVPLLYVDSLINIIIDKLSINSSSEFLVNEDLKIAVEDVNNLIDDFKETYFKKGNIPELNTSFKTNLFNTFHSYIEPDNYFPRKHNLISDERGSFSEILQASTKGQISYSCTVPNFIRGNHFHTRKIERFSVLEGEALIEMRKIGTDKVFSFKLSGNKPSYVDMKIWYTHNIKNIGNTNLITLFWINEFFKVEDPDTFSEKV